MSLWSCGEEGGGVTRRKWWNGGCGGGVDRWVVLILVSELSGMEEAHGFRLDRAMDQTAAWLLREPLGYFGDSFSLRWFI